MIREQEVNETYIMDWKKALTRPGCNQMIHLKKLMSSYSDLDWVPAPNLIKGNPEGANHITACKGRDYVMVYSPNGVSFEFEDNKDNMLTRELRWFNPRNGVEIVQRDNNLGVGSLIPPTAGRGQDWILILTFNI
jgi:hypothetical protein